MMLLLELMMSKGDKMFTIGKIINTHGIKGEVKVKQITDFIERFNKGSTVYLIDQDDEAHQLEIDGLRTQKNLLLLHFTGYNTIEAVESFKGLSLKIKENQLTDLEENEYYYYEIIGCSVYTMDGEEIGIIDSILSPGANDVWVIKDNQKKDILIPYIEEVVKIVDVENKRVIIEPMEGLLE